MYYSIKMDRRWFAATATIAIFLFAVSITSGHESRKTRQAPENTNGTIVGNSSPQDREVDYFEWNNTDDYNEYAIDDPRAYNAKIQPSHHRRNGTTAAIGTPNNGTEPEPTGKENSSNGENPEEISQTNETISGDSQGSENVSNSNETSNSESETNNDGTVTPIGTNLPVEPAPDKEIEEPTTESDILPSIPPEESKPPSDISTQDVGDSFTNFTTPAGPIITEIDRRGDGLRAWSVVVVSVLVSFAVIFTILYFVRGALIRKRRMDQRRLLRGSVSSEGYFYGDGVESNPPSKFEF